ncbi:hypothetical protein D1872_212460 [compost metagenome]
MYNRIVGRKDVDLARFPEFQIGQGLCQCRTLDLNQQGKLRFRMVQVLQNPSHRNGRFIRSSKKTFPETRNPDRLSGSLGNRVEPALHPVVSLRTASPGGRVIIGEVLVDQPDAD